MYSLKEDIEELFFGQKNPKNVAKRKLNEIYDKYGEDLRSIENGTDDAEYFEYVMASAYADEVLAERKKAREKSLEQSLISQERERPEQTRDDAEEDVDTFEQKEVSEDNALSSETGRMAVEAYKKLNKEKIKEDTKKYVDKTIEEQKEVKRKTAGYSFNQIYYTQVIDGKNEIGTQEYEGGYSNDKDDFGGETNYGITQRSLNEYREWQNPLKTEHKMPLSVKQLSDEQAKSILDEMYYKRYRINYIPNLSLARLTFDHCINGGPKMNENLYLAVNEVLDKKLKPKRCISNELVDILDTLSKEEVRLIRDKMIERKMAHHFSQIDETNNQINFLDGWYERARSQYSDKERFDEIYAEKRLKYLKIYFDFLRYPRTKARVKKELKGVIK